MFSVRHKGSFNNLERFIKNVQGGHIWRALDAEAQKGVQALASATPIDTGRTADSWGYSISDGRDGWSIVWYNSNVNKGVNIAIILQFGHGTGTGGYVAGYDYINPAIVPIFLEISDKVWKAVTNA